MLEIAEIRKHFPSPDGQVVRAVDGVSLSIARGELVALYGPSGSGKSTLLKIIAALLRPDSGSVAVDGREVTALDRRDAGRYRLHEIGFIQQQPSFVQGACAIDNAALKLLDELRRKDARRRVEPLMIRLGLGDRLHHLPAQMSSGEQQRVLIARALSTQPKVLLADEPTGNLDTQRSRHVLGLLRDLCHERNVATLLVTHDLQATQYADRAVELRDGRLGAYVADGATR
jgi:putative ABC transport system ATP-binding protein